MQRRSGHPAPPPWPRAWLSWAIVACLYRGSGPCRQRRSSCACRDRRRTCHAAIHGYDILETLRVPHARRPVGQQRAGQALLEGAHAGERRHFVSMAIGNKRYVRNQIRPTAGDYSQSPAGVVRCRVTSRVRVSAWAANRVSRLVTGFPLSARAVKLCRGLRDQTPTWSRDQAHRKAIRRDYTVWSLAATVALVRDRPQVAAPGCRFHRPTPACCQSGGWSAPVEHGRRPMLPTAQARRWPAACWSAGRTS